jgi:xylulokinase
MEGYALEGALQELLSDLDGARAEVAGVGVAGMAESGVPMAEGHPLGPIVAWFDGRGEETVSRLGAALPGLALRIGQRVRTVSSVAKLGWLLADGMPLPQRWLGVPEACLFLLTDAEATEYSLAARTGAYDVATRKWIREVTDVLGVAPDVFPAVGAAGDPMGEVSGEAAARYGLPAGVPVTIAGHDHLAAAEGLGVAEDDMLNSVGTAETLLRRTAVLPDLDRALDLRLAVSVRPGGRGWVVLASATRSGLVLDRLAAGLGASPTDLDSRAEEVLAADGPVPDVAALMERAARMPGAWGVPDMVPGARGVPDMGGGELAGGLGVAASPGAIWAGALQALTERATGAAARMSELTGPPSRMVIYGGGSRSRPWLGLKARAAAVPVVRVTTPEATARGAALAAGVAAGWWPSLAGAPPAAVEPVSAGTG